MEKSHKKREQYYFYVNGQAVSVSEQVYRVYRHYERKEQYFSRDLKTERFQKETASLFPSREDSFDRLLENGKQFATTDQSVEDQVISTVWMEEILRQLSDKEKTVLYKLYFEEKSERTVSEELGISKTALHQQKIRLLRKLKIYLENMG